MNEIKCPECKKAFKIDETAYASILKQVKDVEFERELSKRLELAEIDKVQSIEIAKKDIKMQMQKYVTTKDTEIRRLEAKLNAAEITRALAVNNATSTLEKERDALTYELERNKENSKFAQKLAINEAFSEFEKERSKLKNTCERAALEKQLAEKSLKEKYEVQIKDRDDAIERLRDMKSRLSTKMIGESLEQHCEIEFNRIRATAFPRAYFEKDNDSSTGSKGDYIFRDIDKFGTEIVSVMFEMCKESCMLHAT